MFTAFVTIDKLTLTLTYQSDEDSNNFIFNSNWKNLIAWITRNQFYDLMITLYFEKKNNWIRSTQKHDYF